MRLPYDWKTPTGYLMALFIQYLMTIYPYQFIGCFLLLAFGAFMIANALVESLKHELHSIDQMASDKKSQKNMYKTLSEFIQAHASAKQLS